MTHHYENSAGHALMEPERSAVYSVALEQQVSGARLSPTGALLGGTVGLVPPPNQQSFIRPDNRRGAPGRVVNIGASHTSSVVGSSRATPLTGIPARPHMFRHAMAGAMLNQGAPLSLIQDVLGTPT